MTKINFSYSIPEKNIDDAIVSLEKSIGNVTQNVQKVAVSILRAFKEHGDKPTAERRANALVKALGKGLRAKSMLAWFEQQAPLVWNAQEKKLVPGFTAAHPVKDHKKIDIELCIKSLWYEAQAEAEYKPLADWTKLLQQIVTRAKTDIEKQGEKSKVNLKQLAILEGMIA